MTGATGEAQSKNSASESHAKRPSTVLVLGFPRLALPFVDRLSDENLRCTTGRLAALRVPFCDLVYQIGGGPVVYKHVFTVCKALRRRVVKQWVGSDVLRAREPLVQEQHATGLVENWAVTADLADELAASGIAAKVVPLSLVDAVEAGPLPEAPLTILSYLPSGKFDFYNGASVLSLAERFPDVRFLVVGSDGADLVAPANVEFLGYKRQMDPIYARSHVLLRMPRHDGLSYMVLEALNHGRHVIWNVPFQTARFAQSDDEVASHIAELRTAVSAGALELNAPGRDVVRETFSGTRVRDLIRRELHNSLQNSRDRRQGS